MNGIENRNKLLLTMLIIALLLGMAYTPKSLDADESNKLVQRVGPIPDHIEIWSASTTGPTSSAGDHVLAGMVTDAAGDTYLAGSFSGTLAFGSTALFSSSDRALFVAKLNSNASWGWAIQSYSGSIETTDLTLNQAEDHLYIVGSYSQNVSFSQTLTGTTSPPESRFFVLDVAVDGEMESVHTPVSGFSVANAVIARPGPGGGAYITGTHYTELELSGLYTLGFNTGSNGDAFVASLSGSGMWLWANSTFCFNGPDCGSHEQGVALTLGSAGNLHVLGHYNGNATFGDDREGPKLLNPPIGGLPYAKVFVWTLDPSNGDTLAAHGTNGAGTHFAVEIVASGENLVLAGKFLDELDMSGTLAWSSSAGYPSSFIASLAIQNSTPEWNWVRTIGGQNDSGPSKSRSAHFWTPPSVWNSIPWEVTDMVVSEAGNIEVAGVSVLSANLDSAILENSSSTTYEAFLAELSADGDWLNAMSTDGNGSEQSSRVSIGRSGTILLGFDSRSDTLTFANHVHYPSDPSVVVGSIYWDMDADTIHDGIDNCPSTPNTNQTNWDGDGNGDACDADDDNDGIDDIDDSCPFIHRGANDADGDGCPDGILVGCMDPAANNFTNLANVNSTTCEYGDDPTPEPELSCEDDCPIVDDDGDGVADGTDICPNTPSGSYVNSTGCREDPPILGCTNPDAANYDEYTEKDDGSCVYSPEPPAGNDTTTLGDFTDCDLASQEDCEEEAIVVGGVGLGLIGGGIIRNILRPGRGGGKGGGKTNLHLGKAKDAYDGAKFIADKAKGKKATVGGSDHYLKPGVERQEAMSTAADTALDDYVED